MKGILALASEYPGNDVVRIAAAAVEALLGPAYASLRSKGVPAASAVARIEAELKANIVADGGGGYAGLLGTVTGSGGGDLGALEIARGVFVRSAKGNDLDYLDVLLRVMLEAAGKSAGGDGDGKNVIERRLNAHCGLVRRLLKAAPTGLNYKRLIGEDPLADPLADPLTTAKGAKGEKFAPPGDDDPRSRRRSAAGLAAARARAMSELRSVAGVEHAPALSKLAPRIPGLSGSAVYLAVAQRVLCGEIGGLSEEALRLLRGGDSGSSVSGEGQEELEAASVSVYHLLRPLISKMAVAPEDLAEVAAAVCAPTAAGPDRGGWYPYRAVGETAVAGNNPFPERMKPLKLTVRCRRRVLDAVLETLSAGRGGAESSASPNTSVEKRLSGLNDLLNALDTIASAARGDEAAAVRGSIPALETAWVLAAGDSSDVNASAAPAVRAAVDGVARVVRSGAPPATVEGLCASMRAALGFSDDSDLGSWGWQELDPCRLYVKTTSRLLASMMQTNPGDRSTILKELRYICSSVRNVVSWWNVIYPALVRFCNDGQLGDEGADAGAATTVKKDAVAGGLAPPSALVLSARAEVLTLLRSLGDDVIGIARDEEADDILGPRSGRVDTSAGNSDNGKGGDIAGRAYRGTSVVRNSSMAEDPTPSRLSIPFLRVAELAAEAFGARVSPAEVQSWAARSMFLGRLAGMLSDPGADPRGMSLGDGTGDVYDIFKYFSTSCALLILGHEII